jgi:F-type H+-transporting ATPase subunit epsilon
LNLVILTPEKEVFNGAINSVKVPGILGQFEILNGHAAIVSSLSEGDIRVITADGSKQSYHISRGFIEVLNNEVALLVRGLTGVSDQE